MGDMTTPRHDLAGEKRNMLTAIRFVEKRGSKNYWQCRCDCGAEAVVSVDNFRSGGVKSCGCRKLRPVVASHGASRGRKRTPEYSVWLGMIHRCHRPANKGFRYYGGRGIQVCERWRDDFPTFLADVGPRPSLSHSIERINNDGHYEPENVRWATRFEQARNRRNNHLVTIGATTMPLSQWCAMSGVLLHTALRRLRVGWEPHHAILCPAARPR